MSSSSGTTAPSTRELAAIMFSDIAGYTAIMGRDEQSAMRALDRHREVLRELLPKFNGRLIGEIGDGTLSSFHSAVDAVNCAREIQSELTGDRELRIRIGIHVGDVLFTNNTVLGDGVNVASRIHELAPPGGICISERVYAEIRNKPEFQVKDLGERRLKNVTQLIRVYALTVPGGAYTSSPPVSIERIFGPKRAALLWGASLLLLAAIAWWIAGSKSSGPGVIRLTETQTQIHSIAVLPLENLSGDPGQEYFADGMTDELITDLATLSAIRVISRTSVMKFKGEHREQLPEIAKLLNADAIVEGSVMRVGGKVRITAQLIDARADKHLWAKSYERDSRDVLAIQDEIAAAIAHEIDIELTPGEQARLGRARAVNPEALDALLKGRYFLIQQTSEGYRKAKEYSELAIKIAPDFAGGYVELAWSYIGAADQFISDRAAMPKAKELLSAALKLDDGLAAAHTGLAIFEWDYEFNWVAAEKEYFRAIELAPADADTHANYGYMLTWQGRFDEAERELKLAQQLDPLSPDKPNNLGLVSYLRGDYPKAIEHSRKALEIDPNYWMGYVNLGSTYDGMGSRAEALKEYEKAVALEPSPLATAWLGLEYAKSGNHERARKILEQLNRLSAQMYVTPVFPALIYVALGDKSTALDLLEKAFQERSGALCLLKVNPDFDSLRSEPRFIALMKKIGLDK